MLFLQTGLCTSLCRHRSETLHLAFVAVPCWLEVHNGAAGSGDVQARGAFAAAWRKVSHEARAQPKRNFVWWG